MSRIQSAKIVIVLIPILLFLGLLWNYLVPFGQKTVTLRTGDTSPYIQRLLPDERVENGKIIDEPVYFSVTPPGGDFTEANVSIDFIAGEKSIVELGALKDLFTQAFDFRPLANNILAGLEKDGWVKKPVAKLGENVTAYFRNQVVAEHAGGISDTQIAVYKASLPWTPPKNIEKPNKEGNYGTKFSFRGSQEIFIYKDEKGSSVLEPLTIMDTNQVAGADDIVLRVYSEKGELVAQIGLPDDGDVSADGTIANRGTLPGMPPLLEGLPSGVYRAVLSATSDIWFTGMSAPSPYIAFKNSITLSPPSCGAVTLSEHRCDVHLNTNAKAITIEPLNVGALGTVIFGGKDVVLGSVGEKVRVTTTSSVTSELVIPTNNYGSKGEYKITGEGFFSEADAPFFAPEPAGFSNFIADQDAYNIVVAEVPSPEVNGDVLTNSADFDLTTLAKENGAYKFALSVPRVHEEGGGATIERVTVTFKKPSSIMETLKEIKHFVKLLFT